MQRGGYIPYLLLFVPASPGLLKVDSAPMCAIRKPALKIKP